MTARKTIADHAVEIMRASGINVVMYGDGILTDIAGEAGVENRVPHPLNRMRSVLNALEGDVRFEKARIRGMDCRGRERVVRGFWLREEYR